MASFYDWATCRLPLSIPHEINGGHVVTFNAYGEKEFTLDRRLAIVGSHDSSIQVRTRGHTLEVSGNPTKWLQGHNLFGSDNLADLLAMMGLGICDLLDLAVTAHDLDMWRSGLVELTRLDVTRMYRFPPGTVAQWLSVATAAAHGGHQRVTNRGAYEGSTMYVGQHSRRISLKVYDKASELRRHPLPPTIAAEVATRLTDWVVDTARVEVTMRGMELQKRGLRLVRSWTPAVGDALIDERVGKLSMLDNLTLADDAVQGLPPRLLGVYEAWRAGRDLREHYKKSQFYHYRTELLKHGIDIRNVRPRVLHPQNEYAMGRPMRDFLAGDGLAAPEWAVGTPLLACS